MSLALLIYSDKNALALVVLSFTRAHSFIGQLYLWGPQ